MKYTFALLSSFCVIQLHAQFTIGPEVGFNGSLYTGTVWSGSIKGGVRAGLVANIKVHGPFYVQPGVLYVNNGYEPALRVGGSTFSMTIRTIEVPLNFIYKMKHAGTSAPFFSAGPYVGINAGGKITTYGSTVFPYPSEDVTRPLRTGSGAADDIKLLDFGVGTSFGIQFDRGLFTRFFFHKGFANLMPGGDSGNKLKNFNLGISLGYCFGNKSAKKVPAAKSK